MFVNLSLWLTNTYWSHLSVQLLVAGDPYPSVVSSCAVVGEAEEALLVACVRGVADELSQKDVFVRVQAVDDDVHHLTLPDTAIDG